MEEGPRGESRGLARFAVPECRGRVFGRDTKVPQGSLDFGYPDELTSASVDDEISPRNRARLPEKSRRDFMRFKNQPSCQMVVDRYNCFTYRKHLLID